jgi:biotin carboxyl carrier protein
VLAVVEAMKMENPVVALTEGIVHEIHQVLGAMVKAGELLVTVRPEAAVPPPEAQLTS